MKVFNFVESSFLIKIYCLIAKETTKSFIYLFFLGLILLLFSITADLFSQSVVPIGGWRTYLSHRKGLQVAIRNSEVYTVTASGLTYYNSQTGTYREFTRVDGLSSVNPTMIYYDSVHDFIFIAYQNGMVDYFREVTDIKKLNIYLDIFLTKNYFAKQVYSAYAAGKYIYFATDFGIVTFDVEEKETRYTYTKIGSNDAETRILSVTIFENRLYALTLNKGLYSASLESPNLADADAWRRESENNNLKYHTNSKFLVSNDELIALNVNDSIYIKFKGQSNWQSLKNKNLPGGVIISLAAEEDDLYIEHTVFIFKYNKGNVDLIAYPRVPNHFSVSKKGLIYASASDTLGVEVFRMSDNKQILELIPILPSNRCSDIAVENQQLYIAPSAQQNGAPSYDATGVYYMNLRDRNWKILTKENGGLDSKRASLSNGYTFMPKGSTRCYVSSWNNGLNVFENGNRIDILDSSSTCLVGIGSVNSEKDFIRISGMGTDSKGNLWMALNSAIRPIAMITPQKKCYTYERPSGTSNRFWNMEVQSNGVLWINVLGEGILVYDQKGTYDNSDYRSARLRSGSGSGNLNSDRVNAIKFDLENVLWIGTAAGVCAIYNPGNVFNNPMPDAISPIYNGRNLLKDENITAIAIDGANRKWFGTSGTGVYLFNANCSEELAHFTVENSPLLSNKINDIEVDNKAGEVFFATDAGVISHQGSATEGAENNDNLSVFPSPAYVNQNDPVIIRGTVKDGIIKITTESGDLVREIKAEGGQVVWDTKDVRGNKVQPGVYLAFVAKSNGANGAVTKIALLAK